MNENFICEENAAIDIQQLVQLGVAAYGPYQRVMEEAHAKQLLENISGEATYYELLKMSTLFTCRSENKLAGMAYYVSSGHPTDIYDASWSYIRFLTVDPQFSGLGVAKRLTKMCIDKSTLTGEHTIALHTSEFMDAARHIYEQAGFIRLKEIPRRFGKRYWLYTMGLNN